MELYVFAGMRTSHYGTKRSIHFGRFVVKLHLQFGFGMMQHCRHLIESWSGGTVVLSPRDLNAQQLLKLAGDINCLKGGKVLLDPQFYLPHADHERLCSHDYWPTDFVSGSFFDGEDQRRLVKKLIQLNEDLDTDAVILPGMLARSVDDLWLSHHQGFLETARDLAPGKRLFSTLALDAGTTMSREQVSELIETVSDWGADGYYLVFEHPNGDYLVQEPVWLAHILDIAASLRLSGADVVIGYCNHQLLSAHLAGVTAICSGTWMNVRSFPPDKFRTSLDDEMRRRATWYYCPQALSEYKIPFLDVAFEQGVLGAMKAPPELDGGYVDPLFSGVQPSSVGTTEQAAFRHYLHALWSQVRSLEATTYDEAMELHNSVLDKSENLLATLVANGVRGANRDFSEYIDVNRAALAIFDRLRGPILRRRWNNL